MDVARASIYRLHPDRPRAAPSSRLQLSPCTIIDIPRLANSQRLAQSVWVALFSEQRETLRQFACDGCAASRPVSFHGAIKNAELVLFTRAQCSGHLQQQGTNNCRETELKRKANCKTRIPTCSGALSHICY